MAKPLKEFNSKQLSPGITNALALLQEALDAYPQNEEFLEAEECIMRVMDSLVGWCAPAARLYPADVVQKLQEKVHSLQTWISENEFAGGKWITQGCPECSEEVNHAPGCHVPGLLEGYVPTVEPKGVD